MKRYLLFFALSLLAATISVAEEKWTGIARYEQSNRELIAADNHGKRVVLMGNSITDFWPERHAEFFKLHPNYIGRGISGQTTYQMLTRFREDVIALAPKVVVILAGINDIAENQGIPYNEDYTMGNIITMVELAKAHKIKVVLCSVLPAEDIYWRKEVTGVQLKILRLNEHICKYAMQNDIPYVDYYSLLVSGAKRAINPKYSDDKLHPNQAGYELMEPALVKAVQKYVK